MTNDKGELLRKFTDGEDGNLDAVIGADFSFSCENCVHLHQKGTTCDAFPKGIPNPIRTSQFNHNKSYPGDNGIRFEAKK